MIYLFKEGGQQSQQNQQQNRDHKQQYWNKQSNFSFSEYSLIKIYYFHIFNFSRSWSKTTTTTATAASTKKSPIKYSKINKKKSNNSI